MFFEDTKTLASIYALAADAYENVPISTLPFSVRTSNRLVENSIATVSDLLRATPSKLLSIKGFGKTCLDEICFFCRGLQSSDIITTAISNGKNETLTFANFHALSADGYENIPLNTLPFSTRTRNCFVKGNIVTVSDLLNTTPAILMAVAGFGRTCLDEINAFFSKVQSSEIVLTDTSIASRIKAIPTFIRENAERIARGDFSFADNITLNNNDSEWLQLYRTAYNNLEEQLVFDCINSPKSVVPLIKMFRDYQHEASRHREVCELLGKIPTSRKGNAVAGYINAFIADDEKRCLLYGFFASRSSTIASVSSYPKFENDKSFALLKKFLAWCTFNLREEITQLFEKLYSKNNVQLIIKSRAQKKTLEQIGKQLGVTRERVRQIESKAKHNFARFNSRIKIISKISADRNGDTVLTPYEIEEYCGANVEDLIFLLGSCKTSNYIYDSQLEVFIIGDDSLQDRVQNYLETLPDMIPTKQLDKILISAFEEEDIPEEMLEKAFMDEYRVTGHMYHRMRLSLAKIYATILSKYYPNGIRVHNPEEIKTFREYVTIEFGDIRLSPNDRALAARIASVCVLCGRGTYMLKKKQYLPQELSERIYKYIVESDSPIFLTNTLYSVFEDELLALNIDNKYFLQGILRELFADTLIFSRDYISKDPNITSIYSTIVEYIKKSQYPVSKKQIQMAFPGITEVVINFAISDPHIINYFGEYLHSSSISLSESEMEYLKALIDKTISDGNAHHCREFEYEIHLERPEILTRNSAMNAFSTFSILEYLFSDKYQFARPYIAQKGVDIGRPAERLHDLIYGSEEFNISDISEFVKDNRFQILSLLEFINSCNDQFLLIDSNTLMRIDRVGVTESIAREIEDIILSEISATFPIRLLSLWNSLPCISVPWTDWLLYSVMNKWSLKVEVSTTSNQFRHSVPLIAPAGKMNPDAYRDFDMSASSPMSIADNLDNIDELLEDIIEDEILEMTT